jgi:hypothetical protein
MAEFDGVLRIPGALPSPLPAIFCSARFGSIETYVSTLVCRNNDFVGTAKVHILKGT